MKRGSQGKPLTWNILKGEGAAPGEQVMAKHALEVS